MVHAGAHSIPAVQETESFKEQFGNLPPIRKIILAHLRLSVSEPPMSAFLPHPATTSVVNPHGGSGSVGRQTGRTVDGYVLAVKGVLN